MRHVRTVTPLLAALLTLLAAPATGAESACFSDAARVCPKVKPGDAGLLACLRNRYYDLSGSCQNDLNELTRRAAEFQTDCGFDVLQWCRHVPAGGGRVLACLNEHASEISSNCADAVAIAVEKVNVIAEACPGDLERHCPGVEPGGGRRFFCLKAKERLLTARCREALRL